MRVRIVSRARSRAVGARSAMPQPCHGRALHTRESAALAFVSERCHARGDESTALPIDPKGHTMSELHLVIGAGPVGRHVAELLAARGERVTVATRSGRDTGL
ncbi:MAG: hypothetical protein AAGC90_12920, partial [Curtobacterium sp.]